MNLFPLHGLDFFCFCFPVWSVELSYVMKIKRIDINCNLICVFTIIPILWRCSLLSLFFIVVFFIRLNIEI